MRSSAARHTFDPSANGARARRARWSGALVGLALCACALGIPRVARAGAAEAASAQVLFEDGKRLAATANFAAACPKFAESQRLDPAAGTLIHLANCYEKLGKTASAWATFIDATAAAKQQGRADWADLAKARADALQPRLSRLTITVLDRPAGLVLKRDDVVLSEASFGAAFPVDPGVHKVEGSAPGRQPRSLTVVVRDGDQATTPFPRLELETTPTPALATASPGEERETSSATLGYVLGAVGLVGVGVGATTGLLAIGKNTDSKRLCPTAGLCTSQEGVNANASAQTLGTVSTVGFIAGGLALAAGAYFIFTSPPARTRTARALELTPALGVGSGALFLGGAF